MNRNLTPLLLVLLGLAAVPLASAQAPLPPGYVLVDDMILPQDVVYADAAFTATPWPYGVVAFDYNPNVTAANQVLARKAMDEIAAVSGVIFVPRTNHPDWITFNATTFNSSLVGMQGGGQTVNITNWGTKYVIVHEIMHALGFIHEQSRPDRDSFVIINGGNISTNGCPGSNCGGNGSASCVCNFNIVNGATLATQYDFLSIMHYGRNFFSSNGQDTITCQPAFSGFQNQIGNQTFMSLGDAQGLQQRYGPTNAYPNIVSIWPGSVTTALGTFTLHVFGSGFFEGSPNANGVQGTKVTWNGTQLPTTYVDAGHLTAQVAGTLISLPQTVQVSVINPAPGWGPIAGSIPLAVTCQTGALALSGGNPATTTNGCQQYSITPGYNMFNVVGVSSAADWDLQMGTAVADAGGNTCDFVAGGGWFGPGTIQPTTGNVSLYSESAPATLQHVGSTSMLDTGTTFASMPAGSIVRAFHFIPGAVSSRTIQVAGSSGLRWKLLWAGNGFSWRSSTTDVVASGTVGGGPVSGVGVVSAPFCLVVYSDGGPVAAAEPLTITMCFDFTPAPLTSSNNITNLNIGQGATCVPFTISPLNGSWNVVGVSGPTDWDLQIGPAASTQGGASCDYVIANGHLGAISPVTGACSAYNNQGSAGSLQFAPTATMPTAPSYLYSNTYMILAFEFQVVTPGNYDISVGASGYNWDLHRQGWSSAWRRAADRSAGPHAGNYVNVTVPSLTPGWHCVVVYHNGGPTSLTTPDVTVSLSPNQSPVVTSLAPASAAAGGPAFTLSVTGSYFTPSSIVQWNGSALTTTFGSASQLSAAVTAALLASPGTATVTVSTPGPVGGSSNPVTFTIENPAPGAINVTPYYAVVGSPGAALTVYGTGFVPGVAVHWGSTPLATTFITSMELSVNVPPALLQDPAPVWITAVNPPPGGGASPAFYFTFALPIVSTVIPASIPVMTAASPPVTVIVQGNHYLPTSILYANGIPLPTTYHSFAQLCGTIDPALIPQALLPGGICLNVENSHAGFGNSGILVVGSGSNQGNLYVQPLAPQPGEGFTLALEYGPPAAPFSIFADFGNPAPLTQWPNPAADMVLAVSPITGSAGPFLAIVDGLGLQGPPQGVALNSGGSFTLPGFVMPSPPAGGSLTLQGISLDPSAPAGFKLTWARHPFDF